MRASIQAELSKKGALGTPGKYVIAITLLKYEPGNAGLRWFIPGAGATKLAINAIVSDVDGKQIARIPVERSIAAGGGFTIGAWKYAFDEVAAELVLVLTDPSKRKPLQ